jgi:Protein of unknown function (DUF3311)
LKRKSLWYLVLVLPFFGTLFPAFYNHAEPQMFGLPFFYWYQGLWVLLTPIMMGIVVIATRGREDV